MDRGAVANWDVSELPGADRRRFHMKTFNSPVGGSEFSELHRRNRAELLALQREAQQ